MSSLLAELVKKNLMTAEQILEFKEKSTAMKRPIQDLLIETGLLNEETFFKLAQQVSSCPVVDLDQTTIDPQTVKLLSPEKAISHGVFPVLKEGDIFVIAMSDPGDIMARDEIGFITDLKIKPLLCTQSQILKYINKYYQDTVHEILEDAIYDVTQVELVADRGLTKEEVVDLAKAESDDSALVKLINKIIFDAVKARASDVHVEPQGKNVDIRYRIDGYLKSVIKIPRTLHQRLAARIKILARLDIAEQRKVQEGRIKIQIEQRKIDLRVSIVPIFHGEKIVLRILDRQSMQLDMEHIGFEPQELAIFREAIRKPQGVILVTGPTGSGKTTTLYSALQEIKCETKNIVTIEDPIEYLIEGINQLQLNHFKDVTFANGLRSILRQDPDVILVGEIRDRETADVAFRASLTGHLVFSTMHTNNAVASITRLRDIGLEPYFIASSVVLFVAQRLVRLICPNCRVAHPPDSKLANKLRVHLKDVNIRRFYNGEGCEQCNFSGFYGRTSIFEIMKVDEKIKNLIFNKAPESAILKEAVDSGMSTLLVSGIRKVAAGLTTLNEVAKAADIHDEPGPVSATLSAFRKIVPYAGHRKTRDMDHLPFSF